VDEHELRAIRPSVPDRPRERRPRRGRNPSDGGSRAASSWWYPEALVDRHRAPSGLSYAGTWATALPIHEVPKISGLWRNLETRWGTGHARCPAHAPRVAWTDYGS
jgi:hypothetical protein